METNQFKWYSQNLGRDMECKYLEQWWVWIVVDAVCVGLYIYKDLYFTAGLYALYAIIAIFGWLNWKKLMK